MDAKTQRLVRSTRADPADRNALSKALRALRRAGSAIPADLLDREANPAREVEFPRPWRVVAERLDGTWETFEDEPQRKVTLPEHRVWWVTPQPVKLTDEVLETLKELRVPGLTFGRSKEVTSLVKRLDGLELRWLSLAGTTGCKDATLAALPSLPGLAEIDLRGRKVTTKGITALVERAPNLVRVSLDRVRTVKDYAPLAELPSLRRLSLAGITAGMLDTLPTLPELTHLSLQEVGFTDKRLTALAPRVPGVQELTTRPGNNKVTTKYLEALASFPTLRVLTLQAAFCPAKDLEPLAALPDLRYLDLTPDKADTGALAQLPALTDLVLRHATGPQLEVIAKLPRLERLTLVMPEDLEKAELKSLAASSSLRVLQVVNDGLGHDWLADAKHLGKTIRVRVDDAPDELEDVPASLKPRLEATPEILIPPWEAPTERNAGPWAILGD